jgi:hypothetical protein
LLNRKWESVVRMKYLVFFAILAPFIFPVYSVATPKEPSMEFLTEWKPLPDRTMILRFGGDYYRHHILTSSPRSECNGTAIIRNKEIRLISMDGNHAWEYFISLAPVFYSPDGRTWVFLSAGTEEPIGK